MERPVKDFSSVIIGLLARGHDLEPIENGWPDCLSLVQPSAEAGNETPLVVQWDTDEYSALQAVRQAALIVLALDLADRLGVHAWAVETILRNMPADYIDLLDDIDDMGVLADAVGMLLGRPIDPDHPLFNPSIH